MTEEKDLQVYIFGEVLFDCFPDGQSVLGGAPFNVAWHLQAFGDGPCFVSRVGEDELGQRIEQAMQLWGMNTGALQKDEQHPTGQVTVSIENNEPGYIIKPDVAYDFISDNNLPNIDQPALLYHGSLALRNAVSKRTLDHLADNPNASIFLDVNLRSPWWNTDEVHAMLRRARWVKLNEGELRFLRDKKLPIEQAAAEFQKNHDIELLFVTLGEKGAFARTQGGEVLPVAPSKQVAVVDTVGAGDAFASVLIHGLVHHWPVEKSLDVGQRFASALVGQRGATPQELMFYEKHFIG